MNAVLKIYVFPIMWILTWFVKALQEFSEDLVWRAVALFTIVAT